MDAHPTASPLSLAGVYRDQMLRMRGEIFELELQMESVREQFVSEMIKAGWKRFEYRSIYYGSHEEYGESDREVSFFFHPSVDVSVWSDVGFSHGHFSQCKENDKFDKWFAEIPQDHFIEL